LVLAITELNKWKENHCVVKKFSPEPFSYSLTRSPFSHQNAKMQTRQQKDSDIIKIQIAVISIVDWQDLK